MKFLYLVRHGKAETKSDPAADQARRLAKKGKEDVKKTGGRIKKHASKVDCIISSPAVRARKTAQAIADRLDYPEKRIVVESRLYPGTDPSLLLQTVAGQPDACERLVLVGHSPQIEDALKLLAGGFEDPLPPGGVVGLELEADSWSEAGRKTAGVVFYDGPGTEAHRRKILSKNVKLAAAAVAEAATAALNGLVGPPDKKTASLLRKAGVRIAEAYCRRLKPFQRLKPSAAGKAGAG